MKPISVKLVLMEAKGNILDDFDQVFGDGKF